MERFHFKIWKDSALNDSALGLLPTYRRQVTDAKRIFCILTLISFGCDSYLLTQSEGVIMNCLTLTGVFVSALSLWLYVKYLPMFLKAGNKIDLYIGAFGEYTIVTIAFCPLYLCLFVELKWFMLNKYGWDCLFLFNTYTNWLLAGVLFVTVSYIYWLIIHLVQKESKMFYLLEKKKKDIYEL